MSFGECLLARFDKNRKKKEGNCLTIFQELTKISSSKRALSLGEEEDPASVAVGSSGDARVQGDRAASTPR